MSDQIDNMLKEMEEFNKKYGLSTAGLSSSPSKKPTKPKKNVFKDAKKIAGDTAAALGAGFAGAMMLHKNIENVEFSIVPYVFCLLFYNLLYNKRSNRTIQL